MKTSLVFTYDESWTGYVRHNRRLDPNIHDRVTPVTSGRVAAHDFVEHLGGNPSGSLEDEIAAFGVIVVTRLACGLIGGFTMAPDKQLGYELASLIDTYAPTSPDEDGKTCYHFEPPPGVPKLTNNVDCEWVANCAAGGDEQLALRIEHWFQVGIAGMEKRFGDAMAAVDMFQNIKETFDDRIRDWKPHQFAIRIDGKYINHHILREEEPYL